jgi:hypothetical protein
MRFNSFRSLRNTLSEAPAGGPVPATATETLPAVPDATSAAPGYHEAVKARDAWSEAFERSGQSQQGLQVSIMSTLGEYLKGMTAQDSKIASLVEMLAVYLARFGNKVSKSEVLRMLKDEAKAHMLPAKTTTFVRTDVDGKAVAVTTQTQKERNVYAAVASKLYKFACWEEGIWDAKKDTPEGIMAFYHNGVTIAGETYWSVVEALRGRDGQGNPRDVVDAAFTRVLRPHILPLDKFSEAAFDAARLGIEKFRYTYVDEAKIQKGPGNPRTSALVAESPFAIAGAIVGLFEFAEKNGIQFDKKHRRMFANLASAMQENYSDVPEDDDETTEPAEIAEPAA